MRTTKNSSTLCAVRKAATLETYDETDNRQNLPDTLMMRAAKTVTVSTIVQLWADVWPKWAYIKEG